MQFELSADGEAGAGNRLLRACEQTNADYVHIIPLEIKIWHTQDVAVLRAELMKLSEDEPLQVPEKQELLERIILDLGDAESVMVYRQKGHLTLFISMFSDEFFLASVHAQEAADGLRELGKEVSRIKNESRQASPL